MAKRIVQILLIEDDIATHILEDALQFAGYQVAIVHAAEEAKKVVSQLDPDIILLDLNLPDVDGLILIPQLREVTWRPIIVVSARQQPVDRITSLKLGADDFISKPFDLLDLETRIGTVLKRARVGSFTINTVKDHTFDQLRLSETTNQVTWSNTPIKLTPTEFRLLKALICKPNECVTYEEVVKDNILYTRCQGIDYVPPGVRHMIYIHAGRLRHKLNQVSQDKVTVLTVGGKKGLKLALAQED